MSIQRVTMPIMTPRVSSLYRSLRPLASGPNPPPIDIKQIRNRNHSNSKESKKTARPVDPQIMKHRRGEQWECSREGASEESVSCNGRGGVHLERVNQIVQRGLEDRKEAETHARCGNAGSYPGDTFVRCPPEHEH